MPPPANDVCDAGLAVLSIPSQISGSTLFANDSATSSSGLEGGPDVAFKVSVGQGEDLVLDTQGSEFDTVLYVRSGSCNGTEIASNDNSFGRKTSRIILDSLEAGDYFVFVDGKSAADRGDFTLNIETGQVPPNDDCENALEIQVPSTQFGSTQFANDSTNSMTDGCPSNEADVAFRFTLNEPELLDLDTDGSEFDTVLYLRSGPCGSETELACNDDWLGVTSRIDDFVSTPLPAGQYTVYVDGNGEAGTFTLNVRVLGAEDLLGDLNNDGRVDAVDLISVVEQHRAGTINPTHSADLDKNEILEAEDVFLFLKSWFKSVPTP
jgi:hypothetical protein